MKLYLSNSIVIIDKKTQVVCKNEVIQLVFWDGTEIYLEPKSEEELKSDFTAIQTALKSKDKK